MSCRESLDGGRLAVKVEDKVVRVRNVKVCSLFKILVWVSQLLSHFMIMPERFKSFSLKVLYKHTRNTAVVIQVQCYKSSLAVSQRQEVSWKWFSSCWITVYLCHVQAPWHYHFTLYTRKPKIPDKQQTFLTLSNVVPHLIPD